MAKNDDPQSKAEKLNNDSDLRQDKVTEEINDDGVGVPQSVDEFQDAKKDNMKKGNINKKDEKQLFNWFGLAAKKDDVKEEQRSSFHDTKEEPIHVKELKTDLVQNGSKEPTPKHRIEEPLPIKDAENHSKSYSIEDHVVDDEVQFNELNEHYGEDLSDDEEMPEKPLVENKTYIHPKRRKKPCMGSFITITALLLIGTVVAGTVVLFLRSSGFGINTAKIISSIEDEEGQPSSNGAYFFRSSIFFIKSYGECAWNYFFNRILSFLTILFAFMRHI